jgi:tRNA-dihydrouridine synthase 4
MQVKESLNIPLIANGDIFTLEDADRVVETTGVHGVMSARGMLENPALFAGYVSTPREAVQSYIDAALAYGTDQFIFHQHLIFMLDKTLSKCEKKLFNCLSGIPAVLDYLEEHFGIVPTRRK